MKAADALHEGDQILIRWKTSQFTKLFRSKVIKVEGNIVAINPIYDKKGIIPFDRGITELIPVGEETVFQNLHVTHSLLDGHDIYLVSGHSEESIYNEHRKFLRIAVNMKCTIGGRNALLSDVSCGGFRVLMPLDYPVGTWIRLNESFEVRGIIVRKSEHSNGMFSYGCQVLDPTNSFLTFITEKESEGAPVLH